MAHLLPAFIQHLGSHTEIVDIMIAASLVCLSCLIFGKLGVAAQRKSPKLAKGPKQEGEDNHGPSLQRPLQSCQDVAPAEELSARAGAAGAAGAASCSTGTDARARSCESKTLCIRVKKQGASSRSGAMATVTSGCRGPTSCHAAPFELDGDDLSSSWSGLQMAARGVSGLEDLSLYYEDEDGYPCKLVESAMLDLLYSVEASLQGTVCVTIKPELECQENADALDNATQMLLKMSGTA